MTGIASRDSKDNLVCSGTLLSLLLSLSLSLFISLLILQPAARVNLVAFGRARSTEFYLSTFKKINKKDILQNVFEKIKKHEH